jgi:hypothetical protein
MLAAKDTWTKVAVAIGLAATFALVATLARRGWLPRLPAPEEGMQPTAGDRFRYYAAAVLGLGLGVVAGGLLFYVPAAEGDAAAWFRHSFFDDVAGRLLGPIFLVLGVASVAATTLVSRMVERGPLLHLLAPQARQLGGADPRHVTAGVGYVVLMAALALHFTLRAEHTTFTDDAVRWRDWLSFAERQRPWSDVEEIRLVRFVEALTGKDKERPHLALVFRGGEVLRVGARTKRPEARWEQVATAAAERCQAPVRRVERL